MSEKTTSTIRGYLVGLGSTALATALTWLLFQYEGPKFRGYIVLFIFAMVAAAWRGYGPGVATSILGLYAAPYFFRPDFNPLTVAPNATIQVLLMSILVSSIALFQRRAQMALKRGNEELEARVKERTAAIERANAALLETERRLHDVLDSVSESFLALDREWRFTYVNRRIVESLGVPADQIVGRVIWDVFPAARHSEFYPNYLRVMEDRTPVHFEMFYAASNRWLEVDAHPTPEGLSAYVVDITQRKRDEAISARLASIVETTSDAIVSKDLEGVVLTWNAGAERLYGYSPQDMAGRSITLIVPPDHIPEEQEILEKLRKGERIDHFETIRVRKDGKRIDVSMTVSPVRNNAGQITGASHIARDITAQKSFEQQLHQMQKLESLGVLAGGVAHDFNNLLVGIVGNASLALDDADPNSRQSLQDIITAGERAADLTRQLLAYAGKGQVYTKLVDLSELIRDIGSLVRTSMSRSIHLELNLPPDLPPVMADAGQMQQIVMNLVINAAEAIPRDEAGTVTVTASSFFADETYLASTFGIENPAAGRYVTLEVQDTGCGMDDATIAKIFDPFFTTKFLGRGLGLSAVLGIARSHGGALKVYSAPGRGTTFKVLFPAADGKAEGSADAAASPKDFEGTGTILLVDDDDMVRKVARATLERQGYAVIEAPNGECAVQELKTRTNTFTAVLLDLTMPVMGGEETLRHIAVIDPALKVILSSGFHETEAMRRFAGKGVSGFLQKPYTAVQLARLMRQVLD